MAKKEVENLASSHHRKTPLFQKSSHKELLEDYLLLCTDANRFYLIDFSKSNKQGDYLMRIVFELEVRQPFLFNIPSNSMRISLSSKLRGLPIVIAAMQHSPLLVVVHVAQFEDTFLLLKRELLMDYNTILIGLDAFVLESSKGPIIQILALDFSSCAVQLLRLKMNSTLQLSF